MDAVFMIYFNSGSQIPVPNTMPQVVCLQQLGFKDLRFSAGTQISLGVCDTFWCTGKSFLVSVFPIEHDYLKLVQQN